MLIEQQQVTSDLNLTPGPDFGLQLFDACSGVSLSQTAVRGLLHVDLSHCGEAGNMCSLSEVGVSALVVRASGLNPLRPPSLDIPQNDT